jgi:peptidoglycan-associated lipoprotein
MKMFNGSRTRRSGLLAAALGTVFVAAGCAHVGEEEFQTEMDLLREEMTAGDQAVAERVDRVDQRVDALEDRLDRVQSELAALDQELDIQLERLEASLRVHMPVHFGFDEDRIDSSQEAVLDRVGSVLQEYYPGAILTVEGFTDPTGSEAYNLRLGQRRADAVRSYMIENVGWTGDRIRAVSYGEDTSRLVRPGAAGPGAEARVNRRVVVVIDHAQDGTAPATVTDSTE